MALEYGGNLSDIVKPSVGTGTDQSNLYFLSSRLSNTDNIVDLMPASELRRELSRID
jgi:hypothetical protein